MKLKLFLFCNLILISSSKNMTKLSENDNILRRPSFLDDAYVLLMFNGSSDLKNYATFSEFKEENKITKKYNGVWEVKVTNSTPFINDYALVMNGESAHSAISFGLVKPFRFTSGCLVVQYDTRFPTDHDCGGAYIKLLPESHGINMKYFSNSTPYTIMFGPDKCGMDFEVKFLFQYKDPISGEFTERKFKEKEKTYPRYIGDNVTHVYTLVTCENNTVKIFKDLKLIQEGNLFDDFEPPLGGVRYVEDPNDVKPEDWDDREEVPDSMAKKPYDWDEDAPEFIPDMHVKKPKNWLDDEPPMVTSNEVEPQDWDEEENGKWNPPMLRNHKCKINGCGVWSPPKIRNVNYRGKWNPPIIKNKNYKGEWKPRLIENPLFRAQLDPYKKLRPLATLGIEIYSQKRGIYFDNFLITDNVTLATIFAMYTWWPKYKVDTVDMPHYQDIFNKSKSKTSKPSLSTYIHWFWASVPLVLGFPLLSYVTFLIIKKSNRDPDLVRDQCLLRTYQLLKMNDELYRNSLVDTRGDLPSQMEEDSTEVSDEAINQLFGGENDRIAAIIRKRICRKENIEKMQFSSGDVL